MMDLTVNNTLASATTVSVYCCYLIIDTHSPYNNNIIILLVMLCEWKVGTEEIPQPTKSH
jgi:hypothetical protein